MNRIRESMEGIRASSELKARTLQYLERRRGRRGFSLLRPAFALAALCLLLLAGTGGYAWYSAPVSYISMDVNPSIELGINRFGRVTTAEAYNRDGEDVLRRLTLKNKPYAQAVRNLLEDETFGSYLTDSAALVFTIISDRPDDMRRELESAVTGQSCQVLTYVSDSYCMQEAHSHHMSFGKYRAYQELAEYDRSVTVEQCHTMSMGEIQERIDGCRSEHEQHHTNTTDTGQNIEQEGPGQEDTEQGSTGQGNTGHGHHGGHHNR